MEIPIPGRVGQFEGGFTDQYIFRVADTYLLRAEAYYWQGDLDQAAAGVNAVRVRELYGEEPRTTKLSRVSYIMANTNLDGYSLDNMHETNYYYDRVMSVNTVYNKGTVYAGQTLRIAPHHIYWPIPQAAIDANKDNVINQNPGYQGAENNAAPKTEVTEED